MGTQPTIIAVLVGTLFAVSGTLATAPVQAAEPTSDLQSADPQTSDKQTSDPQIRVDETLTVIGRSENIPLNVAANVAIIDAAAIEQSGATTLTEVLRGQNGIQIADSNTGAIFAMRGFSAGQAANNTLILLDGRRLNNIDIAAPSINAIPLNQVERVEILSGSAGVLYGDQAVGGVINIITKAPEGSGGSMQLSGGSFSTYEGRGDLFGAINDKWRVYGAVSYNQGDNYRKHNANETTSILGRLQYRDEGDSFFVEGSYYDNHRELPGALSLDQFKDDPTQATTQVDSYMHEMTSAARLGIKHQLTQHWQLAADVNYSDTLTTGLNTWSSTRRDSRSLLELNPKAVGTFTTGSGELRLVTGLDLSRGESEFSSGRSNEQKQASAYVQATVPLTEELSYIVGGRYAKVEDELVDPQAYASGVELDQDAHGLELGINYRPSRSQRFYLRFDENFRFAKVDEQAYTSANVLGLDPQTGYSYEAGWDLTLASHTLRVSAYRLDLEDEIVFDASAASPAGGSFPGANVNADASRRYGVNLDWDWQLSQAVQLGLEYHYIDAEFTEGLNLGKALSWVAENSGRAYVSYDISDSLQLFAEGVYTGERFMEGDNANQDPKLQAYTLTNLALNYSHQNWLASLRVDNLLDEDYVSAGYYSAFGSGYYAGTGRNLRLSVSYRF
ncbi:TonB-dependent receptor [Shewanella sp. AS1]|uniref:TonB-dependent receptor n=1 Tax=Shewanella sp. AS1 TaxID=2907626 RepID=UPI001F1B6E82|nr:TonB-dependent receptor [Shewanella sp. AS1]MCE9679426.1 TonB-dependent receptor [Shewanella sp. AS1]